MTLHVLNGDAMLPRFREAGVKGEFVSWPDMMSEGPLPDALRSEAAWRTRAAWLAPRYRFDPEAYVRDGTARLARIAEAARDAHDVTLWFHEELFCQANLCMLLDWLGREAPGASLHVVLESHEPPVGGLREMMAERSAVTPEMATLARAFWNAITSADPTGVPRLLRADLSAWPGLATGLDAHLMRFPDAEGLDGVEAELLRLLSRGPTTFPELFLAWQETSLGRACGFGDAQVEVALREMGPLVAREGERIRLGPGARPEPRERWIGGCHLARGDEWRREGGKLVRGPPR